ncbi:hypothetical protein [Robiginitomaculum antarcticum]|uniref:hypothetical protein n=1 Tax=Robiginitomaculum antarcticum TaxID=437507 RepID=UPI00037F2277|nr:hypothetical protein [Robiginitomaculum antarcticum]
MYFISFTGRLRAALTLVTIFLFSALPLQAQRAVPDENVFARLVWSTMIALDNANRTGNYSVLYALGSPSFQQKYPIGQLSQSFSNLRTQRVDVGRAIMIKPTYYISPAIIPSGDLRLRGAFEYRPQALRFDLIYRNIDGGWRLHAISVAQMDSDAPR